MTGQVDIPEEGLRQLFREQGVPIWAIAQKYECSSVAIAHQMRRYDIEPRRGRGKIPAEDTLEGEERRVEEALRRDWGWLPGDPLPLPKEGERVDLTCGYCRGTGTRPSPSICPVCGGKGSVRLGMPYEICPCCGGDGGVGGSAWLTCSCCRGKGLRADPDA